MSETRTPNKNHNSIYLLLLADVEFDINSPASVATPMGIRQTRLNFMTEDGIYMFYFKLLIMCFQTKK